VETAGPTKRRFGFHRWLIVALMIVSVFAVRAYAPVRPHVQVPPEPVLGPFSVPLLGEMYLTNTMVALLIVDLIVVLLALTVRRAVKKGTPVLTGIAGLIETVIDALYNLAESTAGKSARRIFPWMATIILVVLVANWSKLLPGFESIGWLHEAHGTVEGYPARELFRVGDVSVSTIELGASEAATHSEGALYTVSPWVRGLPTDLNFTVALALVSVVMTQVIGLTSAGPGYLAKFFNFGRFARMWTRKDLGPFEAIFPFLDIFVGILELIAEIAKIISFSFRLFGNLFAGAVLMIIVGTLVPVFLPSGVLLFELFVGLIQALVFGMLTLVFMTMATQIHGGGQEPEHGSSH
jgi:F-type H+-transporting ATPase subunit a